MPTWTVGLATLALWASAIAQGADSTAVAPPAQWLKGSTDERFGAVERQMRGFDVAMIEVGYRYMELYWAGEDKNWDFAKYQVEKIRLATQNALERRPKRAASAAMFDGPLKDVEDAIAKKDVTAFKQRFNSLTSTCNACHAAENLAFIKVGPPRDRAHSPVKSPGTL